MSLTHIKSDTLEVFIWHYHTNGLVNRESFSKPVDVATPISRTYRCASVMDGDVANACVNSSYYLVPTSWFLLPVHYETDD